MECLPPCVVAGSSDRQIAVSFAQFDLRAEEKVKRYMETSISRERPVVFTNESDVDMWKSQSVLINTTSPTSFLLAEVGSNQECVNMIKDAFFPSRMETYIHLADMSPEETVYVSIIVSDNGEGTPHRTHVVVSPYMVDGYESQIFAKKAGRRISSWIHFSHQGVPPRPPSREPSPRRNYREDLQTKPWLLNRPSTPEATDQPAASSSTSREPDLLASAHSSSSTAVDKARESSRRELVDTEVETAVKPYKSRHRSPLERDSNPAKKRTQHQG